MKSHGLRRGSSQTSCLKLAGRKQAQRGCVAIKHFSHCLCAPFPKLQAVYHICYTIHLRRLPRMASSYRGKVVHRHVGKGVANVGGKHAIGERHPSRMRLSAAALP